MKTILDWNRRPINIAQSRGGVLVTTRPDETLIAFLKGYEWKKYPGRKAKVEILHPESKIFAGGNVDPRLVLEEVKEAVQYFLFTPSAQKQDLFGGKVSAWFNG